MIRTVPNAGQSDVALKAISADAGRQAAQAVFGADAADIVHVVTRLLDDGPEHQGTAPAYPDIALGAFVDEALRLSEALKRGGVS